MPENFVHQKILSADIFPKEYYNLDPLHHIRLLSCTIRTSILCYTPPLKYKLPHPPVNKALLPDKCGSILHDFFLSTCNSRTSLTAGAQLRTGFILKFITLPLIVCQKFIFGKKCVFRYVECYQIKQKIMKTIQGGKSEAGDAYSGDAYSKQRV